jgi:hypothetical protein
LPESYKKGKDMAETITAMDREYQQMCEDAVGTKLLQWFMTEQEIISKFRELNVPWHTALGVMRKDVREKLRKVMTDDLADGLAISKAARMVIKAMHMEKQVLEHAREERFRDGANSGKVSRIPYKASSQSTQYLYCLAYSDGTREIVTENELPLDARKAVEEGEKSPSAASELVAD